MEFKDIFKKLRTARGLSQEDVAKRLGISRSAIGMYEQGKRQPDFETLEAIADFFNVNMDYLLGRSKEPTPKSIEKQMHECIMVFDDTEIKMLEALRNSDTTTKDMIKRILLFNELGKKEENNGNCKKD